MSPVASIPRSSTALTWFWQIFLGLSSLYSCDCLVGRVHSQGFFQPMAPAQARKPCQCGCGQWTRKRDGNGIPHCKAQRQCGPLRGAAQKKQHVALEKLNQWRDSVRARRQLRAQIVDYMYECNVWGRRPRLRTKTTPKGADIASYELRETHRSLCHHVLNMGRQLEAQELLIKQLNEQIHTLKQHKDEQLPVRLMVPVTVTSTTSATMAARTVSPS